MNKFTFKTTKPTGPYASFYQPYHSIKFKGVEIGQIDPKQLHWIQLRVMKKDLLEDGNTNCAWRTIRLKKQSDSLQEAKDFLNTNREALHKKCTFAMEQ